MIVVGIAIGVVLTVLALFVGFVVMDYLDPSSKFYRDEAKAYQDYRREHGGLWMQVFAIDAKQREHRHEGGLVFEEVTRPDGTKEIIDRFDDECKQKIASLRAQIEELDYAFDNRHVPEWARVKP